MKFKLFSVRIELPFLVVAVMTSVLLIDKSGKFAMCFLSALIHECGHLFSMHCFRTKPTLIKLRFFDIVINAQSHKNTTCELLITLSGPAFNLIFACLFFSFSKPLFLINIFCGIFNLLPIESFDGGHALELMLSKRLSAQTVNRIIKALTFVFLLPILFVGISVLLYSRYNYSLLLISLYLVAVLFLK